MTRTGLAATHLDVLLGVLSRACSAAVERQRAEASILDRDDVAWRCITDREVAMLLDRVGAFRTGDGRPAAIGALSASERETEARLRAAAHGRDETLPLDDLARAGLDHRDLLALVAVAGPELDRGYERIYAYLADDAERRHATVDTLLTLTAGLDEWHELRRAFGPFGPLRRLGLVRADSGSPVDLRAGLSLAGGVLEFLLGTAIDLALLVDAGSALIDGRVDGGAMLGLVAPATSPYPLDQLSAAFEAGLLDTLGLWGADDATDEVARDLARRLGRPLVTVDVAGGEAAPDPLLGTVGAPAAFDRETVRRQALRAAATGGLLWLRAAGDAGGAATAVGRALARVRVPVVLSGERPWRTAGVAEGRAFAEVTVARADSARRRAVLASELPHLCPGEVDSLARNWRLSGAQLRAAVAVARTASVLADGASEPSSELVERGCSVLATVATGELLTAVTPRRGPDLLVLPDAVQRQISEIATLTRSLDMVIDEWGFGRMLTGGAGVKALFVGDPGTGKTLAAEVIAHSLGVQLLKVDLARLVSKWVGETAKHLDLVFREAASGSAVLFFDEADALFGKRGEVRHGVDRYANSEVSHLLQRFEQHDGLVILASNLRDNIDPAFARRFDSIVHFPRPQAPERRRLWGLAFPPAAPLAPGVDLDVVAALDMTGAGIVSAARMAALLAADRGAGVIAMDDVILGIVRQYHTEGRLLTAADLGAHGHLLANTAAQHGRAPVGTGWT